MAARSHWLSAAKGDTGGVRDSLNSSAMLLVDHQCQVFTQTRRRTDIIIKLSKCLLKAVIFATKRFYMRMYCLSIAKTKNSDTILIKFYLTFDFKLSFIFIFCGNTTLNQGNNE